jgi:hypothetical protein
MRRVKFVALAVGAAGALVVLPTGQALAHEQAQFGPYHAEIGFGTEPVYIGYPNSVQLILTQGNDQPVLTLGDSLKVEVQLGSRSLALPLEPNFEPGGDGIQGDYRAWFIPTTPGDYTFHFTGSIGSTKVDRSFTSSPSTFNAADDPSQVQFPAKDPSTGQLATRLDRELPRLASELRSASANADQAASSAKTVAYVGLAVAVLALLVAGASLIRGRSR